MESSLPTGVKWLPCMTQITGIRAITTGAMGQPKLALTKHYCKMRVNDSNESSRISEVHVLLTKRTGVLFRLTRWLAPRRSPQDLPGGGETFSVKSQLVYILGFSGHRVSVAMT